MKAKATDRLIREAVRQAIATERLTRDPVSVSTLHISFKDRTVSRDGQTYGPIEADEFMIPILTGDASFVPRRMNRLGR